MDDDIIGRNNWVTFILCLCYVFHIFHFHPSISVCLMTMAATMTLAL